MTNEVAKRLFDDGFDALTVFRETSVLANVSSDRALIFTYFSNAQ